MMQPIMNGTTLTFILLHILTAIHNVQPEDGQYEHNQPTLKFRLQPQKMDIVLVGDRSYIKVQSAHHAEEFFVSAKPQDKGIVKVLTKELHLNATNGTHQGSELKVKLLGVKPGRTYVDLYLHHFNKTIIAPISRDFEVIVVEKVNMLRDAFMYVLVLSQMMTLLMLALRMRGAAVREVVCRPCALLSSLFCQIIVMPLVSIGLSVALGLPIHTVVCLLILGCCPTGMMSPMMSVIQQAHVELALVHTLIITTAAYGVMPFWLFAYGNFLGLAYDHVSGPYVYISGALILIAGPIFVGLLIQRYGPSTLPRLDRAIPPTCLLLMLMEFTIDAVAFCGIWNLTTWRLLVGTALLPILGGVMGAITSATFRQKLPQIKSVTIVTCVQHTTLAKVIIQMSYPVSDASVMAVSLICIEFFTVCYMMTAYVPHVALTLCWPVYRPLHQHAGIGGLQDSIGDRIVRSMVKAGEITFGKLQQSPAFRRVLGHDGDSRDSDTQESGLSLSKGRDLTSSGENSHRRQGIPFSLPLFNYAQLWPPRSGDHHVHQWNAKLGVCACSTGVSNTSRSTTPNGYPLKYFTDSSPELPKPQRSTADSMESLDYEMLSDCPLPSISSRVISRSLDSPVPPKHPNVLNYEMSNIPLPPPPNISLPPTPPYIARVLSDIQKADGVTGVTPSSRERTRRSSTASAGSDSTQATSVTSDALQNTDELHLDFQDSISTILTHYETTLPPDTHCKGTASTKWKWDVGTGGSGGSGAKYGTSRSGSYSGVGIPYSPPPPALTSSRILTKDLASIEEERSSNNSQLSAKSGSPFIQAYDEALQLSATHPLTGSLHSTS